MGQEAPADSGGEVAELDFGGGREAVRYEIEHDEVFTACCTAANMSLTLPRAVSRWWDAGRGWGVYTELGSLRGAA